MPQFHFFKSLISILAILISVFVLFSDFYNKRNNDQYSSGIKLGLDLQGGSSLVLEAEENVFIKDYQLNVVQNIQSILSKEEISYYNFRVENNLIIFYLRNEEEINSIKNRVFEFDQHIEVINDDNKISINITDEAKSYQLSSIIDNSIEVIRRRIDQTGTREPSIKKQGTNQILVELPGVENPDQIKRILGTTARLTFHLVDYEATFAGSSLKPGYRYLYDDNGVSYAIKSTPEIYGENLVNAKLEFQEQEPVVFFQFDHEAGLKFAEITQNNIGSFFAVVIDNTIISAPRIHVPITGGAGLITGSFSLIEAQEMALLLKAGGLPVPLTIVEERTVGPTLGISSIQSGMLAGILGYLFVFILMIVFYKKLGVIANISLVINTIFILSIMSLLSVTLTLPGIAGIILTIGMAVDANILVYERFAQEIIKKGSSFRLSIFNSFKRVFTTILDSNITTLCTALCLFNFASGPIRGFAITLIIGIICSMFSIMFITRFLIHVFLIKNNSKKTRLRKSL